VNLRADDALLTDLYQLTMLKAYYARGMRDTAVFELFVRRLPPQRNFMIAAGLEQTLDYLETVRFTAEELDWVERHPVLGPELARELERLRFTGTVHAMPEGTMFFPEEPILRVTAPLPEAQLVETRIINLMHFQTLVASKAARVVLAAPDRTLVDFGLRRAHGAEAGLMAARAAYVAGFAGTATVLAGKRLGIPLYGTMAHSFVQTHDREAAAFEHFAELYPQGTTLLVDTYDTEAAARKVVELLARRPELRPAVRALRIDSGDLAALARSVRQILDEGGLPDVSLFASGNLDEYRVHALRASDAPIEGFGVGTSLVTSADAPSLDFVYKLQEYAGRSRRKSSPGKATWPGRKQVYRRYDHDDRFTSDVLTLENDVVPGAEALLVPVIEQGKRTARRENLATLRERAASQLSRMPESLKTLDTAPAAYHVEISKRLRDEAGRSGSA
jgi:nicotinate phosphoribosyltransferase